MIMLQRGTHGAVQSLWCVVEPEKWCFRMLEKVEPQLSGTSVEIPQFVVFRAPQKLHASTRQARAKTVRLTCDFLHHNIVISPCLFIVTMETFYSPTTSICLVNAICTICFENSYWGMMVCFKVSIMFWFILVILLIRLEIKGSQTLFMPCDLFFPFPGCWVYFDYWVDFYSFTLGRQLG